MLNHTVIAIYDYFRVPHRYGDTTVMGEYERILKYTESRPDAEAWACNYVEKLLKERGASEVDFQDVHSYIEEHIRFYEKPVSECLDSLVTLTDKLDRLTHRVEDMERALCMKDGFSKRLE